MGFFAVALVAQSAVFSADPAAPPVFAHYPVERRGDKLVASEKSPAAWTANFPIPMLGQYRTKLARLRGIGFEIDTQECNPAPIAQAHDLDALLTANAIPS